MQINDTVDQLAVANRMDNGVQLLEFFNLAPLIRELEQFFLLGPLGIYIFLRLNK